LFAPDMLYKLLQGTSVAQYIGMHASQTDAAYTWANYMTDANEA